MARPPFCMVSARFFQSRGNVCAGYRGRMVNLWVRLIVSTERLEGRPGAEAGELRGVSAQPMSIARTVGIIEEVGREAGEAWVASGLEDAVAAGLLTWDREGQVIGIADWATWSTSPEDDRRRAEREKKRAQRARSKGHDADVPGTEGGHPADVHGTGGGHPADVPGTSGGHPADVPAHDLDPEDPVDRPPQAPPEGASPGKGKLTVEDKRAIAGLVYPPDKGDPATSTMPDNRWKQLRNLAAQSFFPGAVGFLRWYGEHLAAQHLVRSAAPYARVCSSRGVQAIAKIGERLEDYDGDWEALRRDLWTAAKGLTATPHNRGEGDGGGPWIEIHAHLARDAAQFDRHVRAGSAGRAAGAHRAPRAHAGGAIAERHGQEVKVPEWGEVDE